MSRKYKFHNPNGAYFISFATVNWLNLFTHDIYFSVLADSIDYCREKKGMELFCYCFMPNHVHFIFRSKNGDPSGLIRDYKGFTSKKLLKTIQENPSENRREYFLHVFEKAGNARSNVEKYQLWQQDNMPIELYSGHVIQQKLNYIHQNPVKAGLVIDPIDWKYSSARNYSGDDSVLKIDLIGEKV
jgi:putative transposase